MLNEAKFVSEKKDIKKDSYQFILVFPLRGDIFDVNGVALTRTDFVYKMVYKPKAYTTQFESKNFNLVLPAKYLLYEDKNCLEYKQSRTTICTVSIDYIYNNLYLLKLFDTNIYPVFKKTRDFIDYDIDFVGTTAFAEDRKKYFVIKRIVKALSGKIGDKKQLKRIIKMLKFTDILTGNFGLEARYDSIMRGKIGIIKKYKDRSIIIQNRQNGRDIYLTLDIKLNEAVKNELRNFCKKLRTNCAAVGVNAKDGSILFFSEVKKENLEKPTKQFYFSHIYQGLFSPGSVLKPFIALELLEKNVISRNSRTYCGGKIKLYNRIFNCWNLSGHGNIDVVSALEHSCNVFFYENIHKLNARDLQEFIYKYRLNKRVNVDLPNEFLPKINVPVNPLNKTLFAIGQIDIYVSLLKLAQLYSLFYNKNFMPVPHIAKIQESKLPITLKLRSHRKISKINNSERIYVKVKSENVQFVKQGLYNVVHSKTGTAHSVGLEKYEIYGKTGTVEVGSNLKPHSLFCGLWEGTIPVSLCVIIEHSGSGRNFAAKFTYTLISLLEKFLR